jgi:hypothetical protein
LNEALQLTLGEFPLVEIHEVCAHASLGKKTQRLSRIGTLFHAEDLNFHLAVP